MAGPFKMKGSPMQRNFGIGSTDSPMKQYEHLTWEARHKAKLAKNATERAKKEAVKQKSVNENKTFGPKKSESTAAVDSLQKVTNDILISNTPNPNRKAEYKASEKKMNEAGDTVAANRKYNVSRGKYIKKTQKINQSGNKSKSKGTVKKTGWWGLPWE